MSSRPRQSLEVQTEHQRQLKAILAEAGNDVCGECGAANPKWASMNLGIFLCIRCCGLHRRLGVDVSRVRSLQMDLWEPEEIAHMAKMGNDRVRAVYEAKMPDSCPRVTPTTSASQLIRRLYDKYVHREFYAIPEVVEPPAAEEAAKKVHSPPPEVPEAPADSDDKLSPETAMLREQYISRPAKDMDASVAQRIETWLERCVPPQPTEEPALASSPVHEPRRATAQLWSPMPDEVSCGREDEQRQKMHHDPLSIARDCAGNHGHRSGATNTGAVAAAVDQVRP
ncbi:putative GTPase activating protein for Arf [Novymonas esmeraldas]|uniref:GTPase activating protein for Arf n=1 Tax=Novymonas esmeraldas TaxID=1808958 RepID=A0AAW0EZE0_9TRYP